MRRGLSRVRGWFPLPLVAIVVLLFVLILLTPNLVTTRAGSLCSEAQLLVDWSAGSPANVTHFYVRGICTVRYASIVLGLGTNASAPGPFTPPVSAASFHFTNVTRWNGTIVAAATTSANPVALNVSALYVDTDGNSALFVGTYDFDVSGGSLYYESYAPAAAGMSSTPVSSLPLTFPLTESP